MQGIALYCIAATFNIMRYLLIMFLFVMIIFSGCASSGKVAESIPPSEIIEEKAVSAREMAPAAYETQSYETSTQDRKVIYSANLVIEVESIDKTYQEVLKIISSKGGYISNSQKYETGGGRKHASINARVPASNFNNTLEELRKTGRVKSESLSGKDVTEEFIDIEARLRNYERQEKRYLDMLDKAQTVEDMLKVEQQLERVRGEIERLQGRIKYLNNRVEFASIQIELSEPEPITGEIGLRGALREAVDGFIDTTRGLIVLTGTLSPVVIVLIVVYIVFSKIRKFIKKEE